MSGTKILTRDRPEDCLSDLTLDRMLAGELVRKPENSSAEAHLARCALCSSRLDELRRGAERFPEEVWVAGSAQRAARTASGRRYWIPGAAMAAVAAVFALFLWPRHDAREGERIKGSLGLQIVARHVDGHVEQLLPGANLSAEDAIRFRVSSRRAGYLGIIGIDSKPAVTAYVPSSGQLLPIPKGRDQLLEGSILLDETLGAERIFAVLCNDQLIVDRLIAAGKRALDRAHNDPQGVESLDLDCSQASFPVQKVRRQ
jgi:hypothetical protein